MFCSLCGGELDTEGWCPNYCLAGDPPTNGIGFDSVTGRRLCDKCRNNPVVEKGTLLCADCEDAVVGPNTDQEEEPHLPDPELQRLIDEEAGK